MKIKLIFKSIGEFFQKEVNRISFFLRRIILGLTNKERRILLILLALLIILLVARFYNLLTQKSPDKPKAGGIYKEATFGDVKTLNPFFAQSQVEKDVSSILFLKLIDLDNQGKWHGVLLSNFKVEQNQASLEIKKDAYWDNGDSVTADDFIFTVNLFKNVKSFSLWQQTWKDISVTKVSDKKVTLTYPDNGLAYKNLRFPLLPSRLLADKDLSKIQVFEFNIQPVGDGSFMFGSLDVQEGQRIITLKSNPKSFNKPYIDELQFIVNYSLDQAVNTFESTSFSGLVQMPIEEIPNLKDKRIAEHPLYLPSYTALFYNLKKAPFDNLDTRTMLDMAINRDQIVLNLKYVKKTVLPLPSGIVNDTATFDPAKSKNYLQSRFAKQSFKLSYPDSYIYAQSAQQIVGQFSKVGVKVVLDPQPELTLWYNLQQGNYQMALWSETVGNDLDLSRWYSTNELNFFGFSVPEIDDKIAAAQNKDDSIVIARLIHDQYPASFLYTAPYIWASRSLRGVNDKQIGEESSDRFKNIAAWYLVQPK
jgi:peptide/nickel transport system substrate-binding protein